MFRDFPLKVSLESIILYGVMSGIQLLLRKYLEYWTGRSSSQRCCRFLSREAQVASSAFHWNGTDIWVRASWYLCKSDIRLALTSNSVVVYSWNRNVSRLELMVADVNVQRHHGNRDIGSRESEKSNRTFTGANRESVGQILKSLKSVKNLLKSALSHRVSEFKNSQMPCACCVEILTIPVPWAGKLDNWIVSFRHSLMCGGGPSSFREPSICYAKIA